jgi:hypothetical protein
MSIFFGLYPAHVFCDQVLYIHIWIYGICRQTHVQERNRSFVVAFSYRVSSNDLHAWAWAGPYYVSGLPVSKVGVFLV